MNRYEIEGPEGIHIDNTNGYWTRAKDTVALEKEITRLKELNREMVGFLQGMNNRRKRNEEIYFDSPFFNNAMKLLDKLEAEGVGE